MGDEFGPGDKRYDWLQSRVRAAFSHVADPKFEKSFAAEEVMEALEHFVTDEDTRALMFSGDALAVSHTLDAIKGKGRSLIFVKKAGGELTGDGIASQVQVMDLGGDPLTHMDTLLQQLYLPVLSNPDVHASWGDVITKQVLERLHGFISNVSIAVGHTQAQTRLPLPAFREGDNDKTRIALLESAIVTWTRQINSILKLDPETTLRQGLNPTPDAELTFWRQKAGHLNAIVEQLQSPQVRRVLRALEASQSTYCATFAALCREAFAARIEANDNAKYLRTLEEWFENLSGATDFATISDLFKPVMHIILLIWKNSKHYNRPPRLMVLMRQICNVLIEQATGFISGKQVFELIENEEIEHALEMLRVCLRVCNAFKKTYYDYKATADAECPSNQWELNKTAIFMRLDGFLERCHDVLDLTQTVQEFSLLEKAEVGGTKGKTLTETVKQIYADFNVALEKLQKTPYDLMDVESKQFDDDYFEFRSRVKEFDRQLGRVLIEGFDDCTTTIACFKLFDAFDPLVHRASIEDALEKKYLRLVQLQQRDLELVQRLFVSGRDAPPLSIAQNMPRVIAALFWGRGLGARIEAPIAKLRQLATTILERPEAKELLKLYGSVSSSLAEYENQKIEEWGRDIDATSQARLLLPLLRRADGNSRDLVTNFDATLTKLLREVKYFLALGIVVPENALEIYQRAEIFRKQTANLDLLANAYNEMLRIMLPVEAPLFKSQFETMDNLMASVQGDDGMNWLSADIDSFIEEGKEMINTTFDTLRTLKSNMKEMKDTLESWNTPVLQRGPKPQNLDDFTREQKGPLSARHKAIKEGTHTVHNLLKESNKVLKISAVHPNWLAYVDFLNNILVEGIAASVACSVQHLLEQVQTPVAGDIVEDDIDYDMQPWLRGVVKDKVATTPMLEVALVLKQPSSSEGEQAMFQPPIGEDPKGAGKGILNACRSWVSGFLQMANIAKRLDAEGTFMREMHSDPLVMRTTSQLQAGLKASEARCEEVRVQFLEYRQLWELDVEESFQEFLAGATTMSDAGVSFVKLDVFADEIQKYRDLEKKISKLPLQEEVGWIKLDTSAAKASIAAACAKWIFRFTSYLYTDVVSKLTDLNGFMEGASGGLQAEVAQGDDEALTGVMRQIIEVQTRKEDTEAMFDPLHKTLQLLKSEGFSIGHEKVADMDVQEYLEGAPVIWEKVVKKTFSKKEEIMPIKETKAAQIKEDIEEFYLAVRKYRTDFRKNAPFSFGGPPDAAYPILDKYMEELIEKEKTAQDWKVQEKLFELRPRSYPEMGDTRKEIRLLKMLWDFKAMIQFQFASWTEQLWAEIDTESLEDQTKQILKNLRKLGNDNAVIKGWDVYRDIEKDVKDMATVLPLINELHSPSMRDRHWASLSEVCSCEEPLDPNDKNFALSDMLGLKLHEHVDDVEEVVEVANKELKIEGKLADIAKVWGGLELDYRPHKASEICLIQPSEELIESLEGNQLELQTIVGMGKFVDYFRDKVMYWQQTLGEVETVISEWVKVCKSWAALESIFLASADIRSQLPDDTKRFEGIDSEFKDLMKDAVNVPNVVAVCCEEGRADSLKDMTKRLELCQKALNEYLDVKKKIFPRFYFVSNVALLQILSNGNDPPKIMSYIGDCYDSLRLLTQPDPDSELAKSQEVLDMGGWSKVGLVMVAKDGEEIELPEKFHMTGAVEDWLNKLTVAMNEALQSNLNDSLETAVNWEVDKPRHLWLFDWPAQIVLTGTSICWTEETQASLEEFEGGQEDAVKKYRDKYNGYIDHLIQLVLGKLSKPDRTKIISLITIDVHARDVVQKLVDAKTEGPSNFLWQQQMRLYWRQEKLTVDIQITDFRCEYVYEWVGNSGRLVITPLTDRCYITLTMALRLYLGGAPAGPAGTGKTETTKDLARVFSIPCYVFNCSDQMNFESLGDIFRGLCQSGAWGCFDEFNRISIEVLSVVATQVKTVQDAIVLYSVPSNREEQYQMNGAGTPPRKVGDFEFMATTISLIPTCGFWITMNPGYAGRTELPENLKTLFRSCAMIRPDLKPICENMLMSEGFLTARTLAIKFVTLYKLNAELLSPQRHYDWGLRAVKSVLRVAGALKRGDPDWPEALVLMRALRDFNTPKIPAGDTPIFLRLINDLFMGMQVDPKTNEPLREKARRVAVETGLQGDDAFALKVEQFQDLLDVRHSVFMLGPCGSGKTEVWKTLLGCWNLVDDWKEQPPGQCFKAKSTAIAERVNPKSVITDELYGYMTLSKDWKDGCLSIIMRGMSKNFAEQQFYEYQTWKYVVLDGDIDALWIESMNTVMDDNKVLTLVSNERIPLTAAMRMVFEVNSLKNASPATVSRAGILYINEADIGWRPYMETWVAQQEDQLITQHVPGFFDKYIDTVADFMRRANAKDITPIRILARINTICYLLEAMLPLIEEKKRTPERAEMTFVFATIWAFGGALIVDKAAGIDSRRDFHEGMIASFPAIPFPKEVDGHAATVFDFWYNGTTDAWESWSQAVPEYKHIPIGGAPGQTPYANIMVETADSVRITRLMHLLVEGSHNVMLVGAAGTGKTAMINHFLDHLSHENETFLYTNINMNYFTDSKALQILLDQAIDKRSGRIFGPPTTKKMIYFVDDINLPFVEEYGTQNAMELIRQQIDHASYFDREDLAFRKEIHDCQHLAAMNPLIGSFSISERNQRHYSTFACVMPSAKDLQTIYEGILAGHTSKFSPKVAALASIITDASIHLHHEISHKFLPSAIKFVYNWNMRELTNIYQGLCLATADGYTTPQSLMRLWTHECYRVFADRLVDLSEQEKFTGIFEDVVKHQFGTKEAQKEHGIDIPAVLEKPNIHTNFETQVQGPPQYLHIQSIESLSKALADRLQEYNESYSIMDLVLFQDAMEHVTRIARIISNPGGNAMLIGVGGSGKQSLSRLASFICGYEVKQLAVTSNFKVDDLKEALKEMYKLAGVKATPITFLMTDTQIVNEKFLVYINDMLSSGWIPDLFEKDEMDGLFGSIRNEAKSQGIPDTPNDMLAFFLSRVRNGLHIVLCFSPVGDAFRVRARRFPGLINCAAIDWFYAWPRDALISVGQKFLADLEISVEDPAELKRIRNELGVHTAEVHLSVTAMSIRFKEVQGRFNYVTPKSFLELISFYKSLLHEKQSANEKSVDRLDIGLSTLRKTAADVAELKVDLNHTMEMVAEKVESTNKLIEVIGVQRKEADAKGEIAAVEEVKANKAAEIAGVIEKDADAELSQAKPAMDAAAAAVDCLSKNMLTELKGLQKPPAGVDLVTAACLIMLEKEFKNHAWDRAKKMMADVNKFKERLQNYDGRTIPEEIIKKVAPIIENPDFNPEFMSKKSAAAANLCTFVCNIYMFNRIYVKVEPLMRKLEAAQKDKAEALASLKEVQDLVHALEVKLGALQEQFQQATDEKAEVEAKAAACNERLDLAGRLIGGLASENERWGIEIENLKEDGAKLTGDVMLAAAFVSYVGSFGAAMRTQLWKDNWKEDLKSRGIPISEEAAPLQQLTNEANNAKMMSEGLPSDAISIENGSITVNCARWPLIIDPQLQAIKWLRRKCEPEIDEETGEPIGRPLTVLQLSAKRWLNSLEHAITNGGQVIIENLGEQIDATLDPVLARAFYKKGRSLMLQLGGEEVEYDRNFQLYLQTKLANPHYSPEIAAQCTLINFTATETGLEDQLIQQTVKLEKPDLEQAKADLVAAFQRYKIQLHQLEDDLLERLANAPEDILSDVPLIEGLEATKKAVTEINAAVKKGEETEKGIDAARESYRLVAAEGAMLYFQLTRMCLANFMYQYSLDAFMLYFVKAVKTCPPKADDKERTLALRENLRMTIFKWVSRGLYSMDKSIYLAFISFELLNRGVLDTHIEHQYIHFLLAAPKKMGVENPLDWLPDEAWYTVQSLIELGEFSRFAGDLVEASPRFREWYNLATPETEKLPLDWASLDKTPFMKLLVLRCIRPDRCIIALNDFIAKTLPNGMSYVQCDDSLSPGEILLESVQDSSPVTPLYFILSPGVDVVGEVDKLALMPQYGMEKNVSYFNISMGQGQDIIAMEKLEGGHRNGHWVILNNVHLMPRWCNELEKRLDEYALEGSHQKFRVFLTSDPSNGIPIGLLNRSIKLTSEAPAGLKANLKRAFTSFNKELINEADSKSKAIIFGLCQFHAVLIERKQFGSLGYNMQYPFGLSDLRDSAICLANYMEANAGGKVPWEDLRYIFGEIMYGGHIINDFDRLMAMTYLQWYLKDDLLEETELYPFAEGEGYSFKTCMPTSYDKYLEHIEENMGVDTPVAFGLHTNAEIDFRTTKSKALFHTLAELAHDEGGGGDGEGEGEVKSPLDVAKERMADIVERFGEKEMDLYELEQSLEGEVGPYQNVFLQEIDAMNHLVAEMKRSLHELDLGFKGELTMSELMEDLQRALIMDRVPGSWAGMAWPSRRTLTPWLFDMAQRLEQLVEWTGNPLEIPMVTWLGGLITPQSFLTAICQVTAQKNQLELDKLVTQTDIKKQMTAEGIDSPAREGAYIIGLSMQGARFNVEAGMVERSKPKEMFCAMPVIHVKAVLIEKANLNCFQCPCYKTTFRGPEWIFNCQLNSKSPPGRWVLAGVGLLLDITN